MTDTTITGNLADFLFGLNDQNQLQITDTQLADGNASTAAPITDGQFIFTDANVTIEANRSQTAITGSDELQAMTSLANGDYVLSWVDAKKVLTVQLHSADGTLKQQTLIPASETSDPSLTALSGGGFMLAWTLTNETETASQILSQRFDSLGNKIGSQITVASANDDSLGDANLIQLSNGNIAINWTDSVDPDAQDDHDGDLFVKVYKLDGTTVVNALKVSNPTSPEHLSDSDTQLIALNDGSFAVAWGSMQHPNTETANLYLRTISSNGQLNQTKTLATAIDVGFYDNITFCLTKLGNGFVGTWINSPFSSKREVIAQHFDSNLTKIGQPTVLNSSTESANGSTTTILSNGDYLVGWTTYSPSESKLYLQRFTQNGVAIGNNAVITEAGIIQNAPVLTGTPDGGYIVNWTTPIDDYSSATHFQRFDQNNIPLGPLTIELEGDLNDNNLTWTDNQAVHLDGNSGNDTLTGGSGNDILEGDSGYDTAHLNGTTAGYQLSLNTNNEIIIKDTNTLDGNDGTDTLNSIETLDFSGETITFNNGAIDLETNNTNQSQNQSSTRLTDGGYALSWVQDQSIKVQRYDAAGALIKEQTVQTLAPGETSISGLSNGELVITWTRSNGDGTSTLTSQKLDTLGNLNNSAIDITTITSTTTVTSADPGSQPSPAYRYFDDTAITGLNDGKYIVTWSEATESEVDDNHDGIADPEYASFSSQVFIQLLSNTGQKIGTPQLVDTTTASESILAYVPSTSKLHDGGFAVVWERANENENKTDIYLQRYDTNGNKIGATPIMVNASSATGQYKSYPEIDLLTDGTYVVTWSTANDLGNNRESSGDIFMQRFSAAGSKLGTETKVNATNSEHLNESDVTALSGGGYVVSWQTSDEVRVDGASIHAQIFDALGNKVGIEILVERSYSNDLYHSINATADGGFLVTWEASNRNNNGNFSGDVYAKRFDAQGNSLSLQGDAQANTLNWSGVSGVAMNGGEGNDSLTGGNGNDNLLGSAGNDRLDGGIGADQLNGGAGSDTYIVDNLKDSVIEADNNGTDSVESSITWTLASNLENLKLTGTVAINGTGNALNNELLGNTGNNTLNAGAGNDTLDGSAGVDVLIGGTGNDSYIVDLTASNGLQDTVTEAASEGTDTLILRGGATLAAAATLALGVNIENLDASQTSVTKLNLTGNALNNVLIGNATSNTLDGGAGNDTLIGGAGNDVYVIDSASDAVTEAADEGTDQVQTSLTNYTLGANLENLKYTGTLAFSGTGNELNNQIDGGSGANTLIGNAGNDSLNGFAGNDSLDGGLGDDSLTGGDGNDTLIGGTGTNALIGGLGNDLFVLSSATDVITEAVGAGIDTVQTSLNSFTLANEVENLSFTSTAANTGTGNAGANSISGNEGNDSLSGLTGNDTLSGGAGNDTLDGGVGVDSLIGGAGNDVYVLDAATDVVLEGATAGTDAVQLAFTTAGAYSLTANVENATVTAAAGIAVNVTGNELANTLIGNAAANNLAGGLGDDSLSGLAGNDILDGGTGNDSLDGGAGNDSLLGGDGNDALNAGTGVDTVDGGNGNDTVTVLGDFADYTRTRTTATDTLLVNVVSGESIILRNIETVQFLDGAKTIGEVWNNAISIFADSWMGTTGNDTIDGLAGNDTLNGGAGNDTLIGGAGTDSLIGGEGDDLYDVDATTDAVIEAANEGTDRVNVNLAAAGVYTLAGNIENATVTANPALAVGITGNDLSNVLTGNSGANSLSGNDGNDNLAGLAGNDTLNGGSGNDTLDGGIGTDSLLGGTGDDLYVLDTATDIVSELAGQGNDSVQLAFTTTATYTLTSEVENATVTATAVAVNVTGNAANNAISGNAANNILLGLAGADLLTGLAGNDSLDGGIGNDTLSGGSGNDTLLGADGDDLLLAQKLSAEAADAGTLGNDTVDGGVGNDTLVLNGALGDYIITRPTPTQTLFTRNDGSTVLVSNTETVRFDGNDNRSMSDLIAQIGASGNDTLTGLTGSDTLDGGAGDDSINGMAGNDSLLGGVGNDRLLGGAGSDMLDGGVGNDTYVFNSGDGDDIIEQSDAGAAVDTLELGANISAGDVSLTRGWHSYDDLVVTVRKGDVVDNMVVSNFFLNEGVNDAAAIDQIRFSVGGAVWSRSDILSKLLTGNAEDNMLFGYAGNDSLNGAAGDDTLNGGSGNDTLNGGAGNDYLLGGMGSDTYLFGNGSGLDTIRESSDSTGVDVLAFGAGISAAQVSLSRAMASQDLLVSINNGQDQMLIQNFFDNSGQIEKFAFADGSSWSTAAVRNLVIQPTDGNDTITGYLGGEKLSGQNGNDVIHGMEGNDSIDGGTGNDFLYGDSGNDLLYGGTGNDQLVGGDGSDNLNGADGNDSLFGDIGNDLLTGGLGDDLLVSGQGNDLLDGGEGNDELWGEGGNDTLTGGNGADTFVFNGPAAPGNTDVISDFVSGIDKINLSTSTFSELGALMNSGYFDLAATNNHLTYDSNSGILAYDADGLGGADAVTIVVLGNNPLTLGTDFLISS